MNNPMIDILMNRKSIRKYKKRIPSKKTIETVVKAGMQAPFAAQLYSVILIRNRNKIPFKAPLFFIICMDFNKIRLIMEERDWKMVSNDIAMVIFGAQDASYMAENMVIAAEALGLGSCFIGALPFMAEKIKKDFHLPNKVFPLVGLTLGYPGENPPPRPRFPLDFVLFEDRYPTFTKKQIKEAMEKMDLGYLAQDYYRKDRLMIPLHKGRAETFDFDTYSWTEHISRKWGQWHKYKKEIQEQLKSCDLNI